MDLVLESSGEFDSEHVDANSSLEGLMPGEGADAKVLATHASSDEEYPVSMGQLTRHDFEARLMEEEPRAVGGGKIESPSLFGQVSDGTSATSRAFAQEEDGYHVSHAVSILLSYANSIVSVLFLTLVQSLLLYFVNSS